MPKSINWTREILTVLDQYPDITMKEAAAQLHVSKGTIHRWLALLGSVKQFPSLEVPKADPSKPRCAVCEILLDAASDMDGAGSDTTCRFCLTIAANHPWREPQQPVYGGDISAKVLDTVAVMVKRVGIRVAEKPREGRNE